MKRVIKQSQTSTQKLSEVFNQFILEKEVYNKASKTVRNYKQGFEKFCKFLALDNEEPIEVLDSSLVFNFIKQLKEEGLAPASINSYIRSIRTFCYWCMDVERAYIKPFKIKEIEHQEEPLKMFTDIDLGLLMKKPSNKDSFTEWRTWTIVAWVLATGNRAATICEVKIDDVMFDSRDIALRHTKNKRTQYIPISTTLERILKDYIKMWRQNAPEGAFLFPNVGEQQLTTNALRLSFERYCNNRGVSRHNIHGLRHNFAREWVRNNGNMFVLQKVLGHSTLDMTKKYVRLFSNDIKEDFDVFSPLDNLLKNSSSRTKLVQRCV